MQKKRKFYNKANNTIITDQSDQEENYKKEIN